jgi:thiamine biosynthesis lipoprotein ApbE
MKSQALQDLIKNIFSDEKSKAEFMSNPNSVLSRFNLTDEEKKAVLNTHAKLGLVTSDSQQLEAALDPTTNWFAPIP